MSRRSEMSSEFLEKLALAVVGLAARGISVELRDAAGQCLICGMVLGSSSSSTLTDSRSRPRVKRKSEASLDAGASPSSSETGAARPHGEQINAPEAQT